MIVHSTATHTRLRQLSRVHERLQPVQQRQIFVVRKSTTRTRVILCLRGVGGDPSLGIETGEVKADGKKDMNL